MSMKLLVSARDTGAAGHIEVIARVADNRDDMTVKIIAASPAFELLEESGLAVERFHSPCVMDIKSNGTDDLLAAADDVLNGFQPDAVLVGLSHTMEAGVDEALVASAGDRPSFVMQDFWGDVNNMLGKAATAYFVIDEEAARMTWQRHRARTKVVGSPKHQAYAQLDTVAIREKVRASIGLNDRLLFGFFGQPLHHFEGYGRTVKHFARSLRHSHPNAAALYRPHPRETQSDIDATMAHFMKEGLTPFLGIGKKVEAWLAACDVTCSCFSTCCYDTLFLNRYSPVPLGAVVYLLFDDEIKRYAEQVNGFTMPPPVRHGAALWVRDKNQLETLLRYAAQPVTRRNTWIRAQEYLPDATRSADVILDAIKADVKRSATSFNRSAVNRGSNLYARRRKAERTL